MEFTPFKLAERLEEDGDKRRDIDSCVLGSSLLTTIRNIVSCETEGETHDTLPMSGVRETDANGLVQEKKVGLRLVSSRKQMERQWTDFGVPCMRVVFGTMLVMDVARTCPRND